MALLVGYDTLLYRPFLGDTIGGTAASAIEMVPVVVAGYQRLFNLWPDHYVPLTSSVLGATGIENAAMNVEPAPGFNVNGLAFTVDDAQLPALDRRERYYRRQRVRLQHFDANEDRGTKALSGLLRRAMLRIEHSSSLYFSHPVIRAYATGLLNNHPTEHTDARGRYWRWVIERATTGFAKP